MGLTDQNPSQRNQTVLVEFILNGFSFDLFLVMYVIILMGNNFILVITEIDPSLQMPVYFSSGIFPFWKYAMCQSLSPELADLYRQNRSISFLACAIQMYVFMVLGVTKCFIVTVMAYDKYVAICKPLLYLLLMNKKLCIQLAGVCWVSGIPVHFSFTSSIFSLLHLRTHNQLDHFFCNMPPVLTLLRGNTFLIEMLIYVIALIVMIPFMLILGSYVKIISTILKLPSNTGQAKAFATCSSHFMVVTLFSGSGIITYLRPKSSHLAETDKFLSLFYTIVMPMFNPLIYCLRNKDVMMALKKLLLKCIVL